MLKYTIVIPTYNREFLLKRNIEAIEQINYDRTQFELIIVDDGSTDDTSKLLKHYEINTPLNFRYYVKSNNGKYSAVHFGAIEAKGEYFIVTDSDDYLDTEILNNVDKALESYKHIDSNTITGVIGLNYNLFTKKVQGNKFDTDLFLSDPIEMRFNRHKSGDEIKITKTKFFREFNFPEAIKDLKFVPESYVYYGLCSKYKFVYTNKVLQYIDYQEDGITRTIGSYRVENSYGCYLAYKRYIDLIEFKKSWKGYFRNFINYIRFALHSKNKIGIQKLTGFLLFPIGLALYLNDIRKLTK